MFDFEFWGGGNLLNCQLAVVLAWEFPVNIGVSGKIEDEFSCRVGIGVSGAKITV